MPKRDFTIDNSNIIGSFSIEAQNIWGERSALFPSLMMYCGITLNSRRVTVQLPNNEYGEMIENFTLLNLSGEVNFIENQNTKLKLCNLLCDPIVQYSFGREETHRIYLPLDQPRLKVIEEKRRRNVRLEVKITMLFAKHPLKEITDDKKDSSVKEFWKSSFDIELEIPETTWVDSVLNNLTFAKVRIVEIAVPPIAIPSIYDSAIADLEEANRYFLIGDNDKAISHCRRAIEVVPEAFQLDLKGTDKPGFVTKMKALLDQHLKGSLTESKSEALLAMLKGIWNVSSIPNHPSPIGYFSRNDAELLIMVTGALLSYIGKAFQKN